MPSEIFFRGGLDNPNQLEIAKEIRFCPRRICACFWRSLVSLIALRKEVSGRENSEVIWTRVQIHCSVSRGDSGDRERLAERREVKHVVLLHRRNRILELVDDALRSLLKC